MPRTRSALRPQGAVVLNTYRQPEDVVSTFAEGHLNLLILVGGAGLAKSRTVREKVGGADKVCWIEGTASPFGMYLKLYRHRDQFVIIDDVDSLYANKDGIRLLKSLCQTEPVKTVTWNTATRALERENVPREFQTSSRVAIIANDWKTLDRNVAALQNRGNTVVFEPTAAEVHRKTGEWFDTQSEVYRWFGENLGRLQEPSMRLYVNAEAWKKTGLDWKDTLLLRPVEDRQRLVAELKADASFSSEEARVQAFQVRGGGCRATYFNHSRRLKQNGLVAAR